MTKLVKTGRGGGRGAGDRGGRGGRGAPHPAGKHSQPEKRRNAGWKDAFNAKFKWKARAGKAVKARANPVHPAMRPLPKGRELTPAEVRKMLHPVLQPVRTYSSRKDATSKARGAARVDVMIDSVKEALNDVVTEQEPYERFNGRLAMVGFAFAVVGDTVTGGSGPLEQLNGETGIPVIDAELFGAFFLLGVLFNVVATGVTVGTRAWQKGKSVS